MGNFIIIFIREEVSFASMYFLLILYLLHETLFDHEHKPHTIFLLNFNSFHNKIFMSFDFQIPLNLFHNYCAKILCASSPYFPSTMKYEAPKGHRPCGKFHHTLSQHQHLTMHRTST